MVIVATIALSTMVSNHIVIPLWLHLTAGAGPGGDLRRVLLMSRRLSIVAILGLGYLYFLVSAPRALAAIGLISFAGMAQVAPALIGALYWRGATRAGALAGLAGGFVIWAYTLFLPSFEGAVVMSSATIDSGLFGIAALRPRALLGLDGLDPLVHSLFWSMVVNVGLFVGVSLATTPRPLEEFQAAQFVDVFHLSAASPGLVERSAAAEDLLALAVRILGPEPAQSLFAGAARRQGKAGGLPEATDSFIQMLERELAGSVGAASAHELVSQLAGRGTVSVDGLMRIADETIQLIDAKRHLERQSRELEAAASQLRDANAALKRMDALKDAFLSQVSHELRTPMTSIRSFAEILGDMPDVSTETAKRFLGIIREESQRLTRLLDEILDLSFLESGRVTFKIAPVRLAEVIDRALAGTEGLLTASGVPVSRAYAGSDLAVETDFDRVAQVVINLVSNSVKYGGGETPDLTISVGETGDGVRIDVADHGPGIPEAEREEVFEKFARLGEAEHGRQRRPRPADQPRDHAQPRRRPDPPARRPRRDLPDHPAAKGPRDFVRPRSLQCPARAIPYRRRDLRRSHDRNPDPQCPIHRDDGRGAPRACRRRPPDPRRCDRRHRRGPDRPERRSSRRGRMRGDAGAGEHPSPPLPDADPHGPGRPGRAALRLAAGPLSGLGAHGARGDSVSRPGSVSPRWRSRAARSPPTISISFPTAPGSRTASRPPPRSACASTQRAAP